jgi:hypothetical protein
VSKPAQLFLVTALVYLGVGLVLQAVALFDVWLGFNPLAYTSVGSTIQTLLVGWLTQSLMAIIHEWLGKPLRLMAVVWFCLNVGLLLAIIGQPVLALTGNDIVGGLLAMGGLLQLAGGMLFAVEATRAVRAH